jgi:tetratricopeptide (TPR) repeat protein
MNGKAIEVLKQRPVSSTAFSFHYLDFMLGLAKLYRGDSDADKPLLRFVHQFKGRNYIKEAYQKLAWHALLHEGEERYHQYMRVCKLKGEAVTDEDKHAMKEAGKEEAPVPCLLRARLAFDGGYYARALKTIDACQVPAGNQDASLEYTYRKGRILQALGRKEEALNAFQQTIDKGSNSDLYFACSAALHAGEIEEKRGNNGTADTFYRKCLSLKPDDYQAGLHQKAKAGLERVK